MKKATRKSSIGCNSSVRSFSTRFSLQSFVKRVEKLTEDQKDTIKRMGFGNLLQIPYQMLCKSLLVELMERWSCEKRAFLLVPGDITISLMDVALILGLRVTGDPVILREDEPFSDLERQYGAAVWNRKITMASIEERLDSLGEISNDDFIRSFLLFIFGTLLFPNTNGKVDSRYLSLLQKLDGVCQFAWGAAVLEDIVNWLCKRKEMNVQYVGGCLIFLQIWSYEHIDIARPILLDCPMMFPRACRWGSSRSHHRQRFTTKFKEMEKNQIMWKLEPTYEESKVDTIKELLEAQSEGKELPAQGYNVFIGKEDNVRTRLQIMDQWIAELANESEMDMVREVHVAQGDCSEQLGRVQNVPAMLVDNVDLSTSHCMSDGQREHIKHPWTSHDSFTIITVSTEDDDNLETKNQSLQEDSTKLKEENDGLRKENKSLQDQLLRVFGKHQKLAAKKIFTLQEQNAKLRKEVEDLRQENQLLIKSSNGLVDRLERLVFYEIVNATEEQSSSTLVNDV